jgi:hypothetical protein
VCELRTLNRRTNYICVWLYSSGNGDLVWVWCWYIPKSAPNHQLCVISSSASLVFYSFAFRWFGEWNVCQLWTLNRRTHYIRNGLYTSGNGDLVRL